MKTGKTAKLFGVDPKTIITWTNEFEEFFSPDARGIGRSQRDYNPDDLIVLNTIHAARSENQDMGEIHMMLKSGTRNASLPPSAAVMGADQAITVYTQLKEYQIELQQTQEALRRSNGELAELREQNQRLLREVGMWEGRYRELKEKLDDEA